MGDWTENSPSEITLNKIGRLVNGKQLINLLKGRSRKVEKFYSRKTLSELSVEELINLIMYLQDKLEILEHDLKRYPKTVRRRNRR